jgi:hypothetical protein
VKHTERHAIEELAELLDGELSADEAAAPLRRLATLAATLSESETVERPSPATRAALRDQLVADIEASAVTPVDRVRDAVWHRTARVRHSAKAAVASAVAAGVLGSAGVAAAAQHALPGDALYGVKRVTESIRLTLASGLREEAQAHLAMAEERLEELRSGADRLEANEIVDTLERMDRASLSASDTLIRAVADGADAALLDDLVAFTERQRSGLIDVYELLPLGARPFADASLEVLRRIDVEVATTVGPCAVCEQVASGTDVTSVTPGDGVVGRDCDCIAPDLPPPPRDPGLSVPGTGGTVVPSESPGVPSDDEDTTSGSGADEETDVVPTLPGPLDEVGDGLDDGLDTLVDAPTSPTGLDEVVEDAVDDLGGLLEPTVP